MAQENEAEEEPSIEEILASIRQIITDDDEAEAAAETEEEPKEEASAPEPEPEVEPEPEPVEEEAVQETEPEEPAEPEPVEEVAEENDEEEEILELTETVEPEAPTEDAASEEETAAPEAAPEPEPEETKEEPAAEQTPAEEKPDADAMEVDMNAPSDDDFLFSEKVEEAAMGAFSALAEKPAANVDRSGAVTIEDIVREEMRPMLRVWLDKNLPDIIERLVQEELERVSSRVLED